MILQLILQLLDISMTLSELDYYFSCESFLKGFLHIKHFKLGTNFVDKKKKQPQKLFVSTYTLNTWEIHMFSICPLNELIAHGKLIFYFIFYLKWN